MLDNPDRLAETLEGVNRLRFEAEGVCPVYGAPNAREQALSYARQRAGYDHCEIQVFDDEWNVAEIIGNEDSRPLV